MEGVHEPKELVQLEGLQTEPLRCLAPDFRSSYRWGGEAGTHCDQPPPSALVTRTHPSVGGGVLVEIEKKNLPPVSPTHPSVGRNELDDGEGGRLN